jgi:hypothetical protein
LELGFPRGRLVSVFLAVIKQAAEAASTSNGPFHGYPPWIVVLVGAVVAAAVLWIFGKLLKWTIWIVIILVLVGGAITAAKMLIGQ